MNEELVKVCVRCEKSKDVEAFVTKRNCCKDCHNERNREWRKENEELNRAIQLKYYYEVFKPKNQK